jgi:hypothetical protein
MAGGADDPARAVLRHCAALGIQRAWRAARGRTPKPKHKNHGLRIVTFNSLKLRAQREGLEKEWLGLIAVAATFDVVVVSDVPSEGCLKKIEDTQAFALKKVLEAQSDAEWQVVLSDSCGPGDLTQHTAFVRKPVEVLDSRTHMTACGVPLDRAPLMLKLHDPRFARECDRVWVVACLSLPPEPHSPARDRGDVQLRAFVKEYERDVDFRLGVSLTEKDACEKRPIGHHVVVGGFGRRADHEALALRSRGFAPALLDEDAGDDVLLSNHTRSQFAVSAEVLSLAMAKREECEGALHSPVVVAIREGRRAR